MTAKIPHYPTRRSENKYVNSCKRNANNITVDTSINVSNAQKENENARFTSDNLDKPDKLVYAVKNLTINNANIMNQTQRPRVAHKAILNAIQKQLLTLATENLNKNY